MIREATIADVPRILEMANRSLAEGPYKDICRYNPEQAERLVLGVLDDHQGEILLSQEAGGNVSGLIAFLIYSHHYDAEPTAMELMWWIEPEYRRSFAAGALLRMAERIAKALGAKRMQVSAPNSEIGRVYKALGYAEIETMFNKDL